MFGLTNNDGQNDGTEDQHVTGTPAFTSTQNLDIPENSAGQNGTPALAAPPPALSASLTNVVPSLDSNTNPAPAPEPAPSTDTASLSALPPPPPAGSSPMPGSIPPPTGASDDELIEMKQQALQSLAPLVDHLEQTPEEKFKTTMMLIQASDNADFVKEAFDAANQIKDDKARAQALLDVVNEINYFTHKGQSAK